MLSLNHLGFAYHRSKAVLRDVSFTVNSGEVVSLLGPNGTGKTTLLRCVLGLLPGQSGEVRFMGRSFSSLSMKERARQVAYVPQNSGLTFPYDVREVVLMGRVPHLGFGAAPGRADFEAVEAALSHMRVRHLSGTVFQRLSGGEKQLVMIARALAQEASLLVLDEPTASLDFANQSRTLSLVRALAGRGYAVLMTTHSPDHAFLASDKVVLMKDGKVLAQGKPDEAITGESLSALYGSKTVVCQTEVKSGGKSVKVCIPVLDAESSER